MACPSVYMIVEWIPYENLKDIKYLTRGGFSEILSATWIEGFYKEWDLEEKKLKRSGECKVVLKQLENVEKENRTWLEEVNLQSLYKVCYINFKNL